jgi:hypothetical protein
MRVPLRRRSRRAVGQSLTEIVIIIFLVGIGTIGLVGLFGDNIRGLFGSSADSLAGTADVANSGAQAKNTKWTMKGGQLSQYSSGGFNPGGTPNNSIAPGGGFNPGGTPNNSIAPGGGFNPGGTPNNSASSPLGP